MRFKKPCACALALSLAVAFVPMAGFAAAEEGAPIYGEGTEAVELHKAQEEASKLYQNLVARYVSTTMSFTNVDDAAMLALGVHVDGESAYHCLKSEYEAGTLSMGRMGKHLAMLSETSTADIRATKLASYGKKLRAQVDAQEAIGVYDAVWVLPALVAYGGSTAQIDRLVDTIAASQDEEGVVGNDLQTTAQAVYALATADVSGKASAEAQETIDSVRSAALSMFAGKQNSDGGWGYTYAAKSSDVDTTGWVLAALIKYSGGDYTNAFSIWDAEEFLVSKADATLDGYTSYRATGNERLSAAAACLGLHSIFFVGRDKLVIDADNVYWEERLTYSGKTQRPTIGISSLPWHPLYKGTDYTLKRGKACKVVGKHTETVTVSVLEPSELYPKSFSVACKYTIKPAKVSKLAAKRSGTRSVKLSWSAAVNKGSGVAGYKVTVKSGSTTVASTTKAGETASSATVKVPAKYVGKKLTVSVAGYKGSIKGTAVTATITL